MGIQSASASALQFLISGLKKLNSSAIISVRMLFHTCQAWRAWGLSCACGVGGIYIRASMTCKAGVINQEGVNHHIGPPTPTSTNYILGVFPTQERTYETERGFGWLGIGPLPCILEGIWCQENKVENWGWWVGNWAWRAEESSGKADLHESFSHPCPRHTTKRHVMRRGGVYHTQGRLRHANKLVVRADPLGFPLAKSACFCKAWIQAWGIWMRLLCLELEASCLQLSFSAYNCVLEFFTYTWSSIAYTWSCFAHSWSFLLAVGRCL